MRLEPPVVVLILVISIFVAIGHVEVVVDA
jgi:hypothetical protein